MPSKQKPIIFLRDKLAEMMQQTSGIAKPVYAATGLLFLASALTLTAVVSLNNGKPFNTSQIERLPPVPVNEHMKAIGAQTQPVQPAAREPVQQSVKPAPAAPPIDSQSYPPKVEEPKTQPVILGTPLKPLKGETILQFGWQMHPTFKDWRYHNGIDIAAAEGETVSAVWPGEVTEIFHDKTAGLTVSVRSGEYTVNYGSLAVADVKKGDGVKAGSKLGKVGASKGEPYPHLHLSVKKGDTYIDPSEKLQ